MTNQKIRRLALILLGVAYVPVPILMAIAFMRIDLYFLFLFPVFVVLSVAEFAFIKALYINYND